MHKASIKSALKCACVLLMELSLFSSLSAGSLHFVANLPQQYDFVDIPRLPKEFGRGEFTLELWVKPDNGFPVGPVRRATIAQLSNWSEEDPEPYSGGGWWWSGNWLLDGFTRPHGITTADTREGSFGLQFYGGGRVRWTFADADEGLPTGKVWAVQAWPAATTANLLDGQWHAIACVRRWREPTGARLELWIDGNPIASRDIPRRVDMRQFWDVFPHPQNPKQVGGWAIGSEVMTAWNYYFTQYEDYKGWVDELKLWGRARTVEELANHWRDDTPDNARGLLAHFSFDEGQGDVTVDHIDRTYHLRLHRSGPESRSPEDAPVSRGRGGCECISPSNNIPNAEINRR